MLAERIETYERLKNNKVELYKHKHKTEKDYKKEFEWLEEADAVALQQSRIDLSIAYMNFFKSLKGMRKGQKVGYPNFKKKKHTCSYRTMRSEINLNEKTIKLPKIKSINFRHRVIKPWFYEAEVKNITITKTSSGKYFASILFKGEQDFKGHQILDQDIKVLGLDCSLDKFYVDQYGNSPEYTKHYRNSQAVLAKKQRQYSRKINGSKNQEKARIRLAKIHEHIARQRLDFIDKLSLRLVKEYDVIVVESLSLAGMKQALKLGKSVSDLGYATFVQKLKYKTLWNDKTLIQADKWFASSKTCSSCGYVKKDLMLQERSWNCPSCGAYLDRDQNAGTNLANYGIKQLGMEPPEVKPVEKKTSRSKRLVPSHASMKQENVIARLQ
jgi:putative transposase